MNIRFSTYHYTAPDGHSIPVYQWLPPDGVGLKSVLHIAHGMSEHAMRYDSHARSFAQAGIAVYAHDQRGHGQAVHTIDDLGYGGEGSFLKMVNDLRLLLQKEKKDHEGRKIFLLGHSMGSFLSQYFFQHYGNEIDGLLLSASNGIPDPLLPGGILFSWIDMQIFGKKHRSALIDKLSFGKFNAAFAPVRTEFDWLSRNTTEVDKYVQDERAGFIPSSLFFYDFFRGLRSIFLKKNIQRIPLHVPVYIFSGDRDPVGLNGKGLRQLAENWKSAGVQDLTCKLYPGGRHEMLNEINRDEVLSDCIDWIQKHS